MRREFSALNCRALELALPWEQVEPALKYRPGAVPVEAPVRGSSRRLPPARLRPHGRICAGSCPLKVIAPLFMARYQADVQPAQSRSGARDSGCLWARWVRARAGASPLLLRPADRRQAPDRRVSPLQARARRAQPAPASRLRLRPARASEPVIDLNAVLGPAQPRFSAQGDRGQHRQAARRRRRPAGDE